MSSAVGTFNTPIAAAAASPGRPGADTGFAKLPEVVFGFWIVKIAATTLGETGGDAVSMSLHLGYLVSTAIFACLFVAVLALQLRARRFQPALYWIVVIASTTVGTTLADFATRSLGIGYVGGSALLAALLLASLATWYGTMGSVSIDSVRSRKVEIFYWVTILFSQTLGTALGDFAADAGHLGYDGGAALFGLMLAAIAALYLLSDVSRVLLFWTAFVLTRPLGATVGDALDKPLANGGLGLDRFTASAALMAFIALCILVLPQRAADHPAGGR